MEKGLISRAAALDMPLEMFRRRGHQAVGRIAEFLTSLPGRLVTPDDTREEL
jgi:hypothetical protein